MEYSTDAAAHASEPLLAVCRLTGNNEFRYTVDLDLDDIVELTISGDFMQACRVHIGDRN